MNNQGTTMNQRFIQKKHRKTFRLCCAICMLMTVLLLAGCSTNKKSETDGQNQDEKLRVVATIFPEYDFLRAIGGEHIDLKMLLTPGSEAHSFEPTPQDIKNVDAAQLFVYVGGESDEWVNSILDSVDTNNMTMVKLMDCVTVVEEELVEGMEEKQVVLEGETGHAEETPEYDEHVWTSPKNAIVIVEKLCDELCALDPEHSQEYKNNTQDYVAELTQLDDGFKTVVEGGSRKEIIVGDRFPFRYLAEEYGLSYYAAFPGCSTETEASAQTVAFLVSKVKEDEIPVVFHIELSNESMCNTICEESGAKSMLLSAVHNITKEDFDAGVTYLDLMNANVSALREALN